MQYRARRGKKKAGRYFKYPQAKTRAKCDLAWTNLAGEYLKYLPAKYPSVADPDTLTLRLWGI